MQPDYKNRIGKLRAEFSHLEVDALLVSDGLNVRYLTGFTGDSSYLLVDGNDALMLSDGRYDVQLQQECPWLQRVIRPPSQKMMPLVAEVLGQSSRQRIAIEAGNVTLEHMGDLKKLRPDVAWVETRGQIEKLRQVKDEYEVGLIRQSALLAQHAMMQTLSTLTPATTERQFALDLEIALRGGVKVPVDQRRSNDDQASTDHVTADGVSFDVIVAFGAAGALCHYRPSNQSLADNTTLLFDWGAALSGYASDISRTYHRGNPGDRFRAAYHAVLAAQLAAIDAIKPGVQCCTVDSIARDVLAKQGLADAFLHSLGHGIGLNIHEGPRLAQNSPHTLEAGMIVTVEPGVYFENEFGIRIEDDVLVTTSGAEVITTLPKGLEECHLIG